MPVEEGVEWEVGLPEPAAQEWDSGPGKIEGGPVLRRVDRLDPVSGL